MNQNLRIEELLKIKGMSLTDLTNEINLLEKRNINDNDYLTPGNLYVSLNDNPTLRTLKRVADSLKIELSEIFKRKNEIYGFIAIKTANQTKTNNFFDIGKLKTFLEGIEVNSNEANKNSLISIKDRFYEIISEKELNLKDILYVTGSTKQNLEYSLTHNPTLEKLEKIANILDVDICSFFEPNRDVEYKGIVSINGEIFTINSIYDIRNLLNYINGFEKKKISDETLLKIIDEVLVDVEEQDHVSQSFIDNNNNFNLNYLNLNEWTTLNGSKENCWSFRNNGDTRYGKFLNFGNMVKCPMILFDKKFNDSESAYVAGCYTNPDYRSIEIMEEISNFTGGGYILKKTYRNADRTKEPFNHIRNDWETFNVNWMLMVLWEKVNSNDDFRKMLEQIPVDAHIIEDTSFMKTGGTTQIWGAKNSTLKSLRIAKNKQLIKRLLQEGVNVNATFEKGEQLLHNRINNIGTWEGKNLTGKCLKLCQLALISNTIPPINFELLNNSIIYWFGKKIEIYAENNLVKYRFHDQITTKVIIAGGREFDNYELLCNECDNFLIDKTNVEIVSGGARGADKLGEKYANVRGYQLTVKNADWRLTGGGIIRNREMAEYADAAIVFWDGKSKGTKNMIKLAKEHHLKLHVHKY